MVIERWRRDYNWVRPHFAHAVCATPTSPDARPLLHRRTAAKLNYSHWLQMDDRSGSQQGRHVLARAERRSIHERIEGVASKYRSDWQYLIAASRIDSALSLATLFSVLAVATKFTDLLNLGTCALYTLMASSISYLIALSIIKLRAPKFLQDYKDYKAYKDKMNSHRWILWEFYHNLEKLKQGFSLLPETVEKALSFESAKVDPQLCPIIPVYSGEHIMRKTTLSPHGGAAENCMMVAYQPMNFDRDLVMAFTIVKDEASTRYVLPIRESDSDCEAKCKELFWIIFTEAAKESTRSRNIAWAFTNISAALFFSTIILSVIYALTKGEAPAPSYFEYV